MRRSHGFTLVEVLVAVAVASLLVVGVTSATNSLVRTAGRQTAHSKEVERRLRAIGVFEQDWRGRSGVLRDETTPPIGTSVIRLSSTADSLESPRRSVSEVRYTASERGFLRKEGSLESTLLEEPVALEFWDGTSWKPEAGGALLGLRLTLLNPREVVVLR